MDLSQRQLEREWAQANDIQTALAMIRNLQREGHDFVVNFQSLYGAPVECNLQDVRGEQPCTFAAGHQDVNIFDNTTRCIFPDFWSQSPDVNADIMPYSPGLTLAQLVNQWGDSIDPGCIVLEVPTVEAFAYDDGELEAMGVDPYNLVYMEVPDPYEPDEYELHIIREAFVVSQDTHRLISKTFHNAVDHYYAPNFLKDLATHNAGTQSSAGARNLMRHVLMGAALMRLSMYRQLALLRVTAKETLVVSAS